MCTMTTNMSWSCTPWSKFLIYSSLKNFHRFGISDLDYVGIYYFYFKNLEVHVPVRT